MFHQEQMHSHSPSPEEKAKPYRQPGVRGWVGGLVLLLLLAGGTGVMLELYGITNVLSGFGRGGRPALDFGFWRLKDVPDSLTAAPYINALVEQDVISGYPSDEYLPQRPISRAEFAALVNGAFVQQEATAPADFEDVPTAFWGQPAIANTTQAGFFKGYGDGTFRPNQPLTRAEAVTALQQGLGIEDASDILKGQPQFGSADSNQPLTRAEAAILIYQTQTLVTSP